MPIYSLDEFKSKILQLGYAPNSQFKVLMDDTFEREITQIHNTQSHVRHSLGVAQDFLNTYPQHKQEIKQAPTNQPFDLRNSSMLSDFTNFIKNHNGTFGPNNEYSYDICRNFLPANLGGNVTNGGGGGHELKIALRLVAEII